jgi:hypothetical protein
MRKFLIHIGLFSLPGVFAFILLVFIYLRSDPFKVLKHYDTYLVSNEKVRVGLNKDNISTMTFINHYPKEKYNSFIFGNSRSLTYEVGEWKKYLAPGSSCYHFDAAGESLYSLYKKLEFVDKKNADIDNVLLILDHSILMQSRPKTGHLFMICPALVNDSNLLNFHLTNFKAFLAPKFLYAYTDSKISDTIKPYMKEGGLLIDHLISYDAVSNEIRSDYYEELIKANQYYTPKRISVFYKRDTVSTYSPATIKENQKVLLSSIYRLFKKHGTNYKVIINPLYNQKKLNKADLDYLNTLFGENRVFDYSGINAFTNDYHNYYEASHYRPCVANAILKNIYKNDTIIKP